MQKKGKNKKSKPKNALKKIFVFFKPYRLKFLLLALMLFIGFIFAIGYPIILTKVISNVTILNLDAALQFLVWSLIFHLGIHCFHGLFEIIHNNLSKKVEIDVRNSLVHSINCTKLSVLESTKSGVIINRITSDSVQVFYSLIRIMASISSIVIAFGYLVYIAFISWQFFLFYLCMSVVLILLDYARIKFNYVNQKKILKHMEQGSTIYNEIVRGYRDIKCLNIKNQVEILAKNKIEEPMEMKKKLNVKMVYFQRFIFCIRSLMYFSVFVLGIALLKHNALDLAVFVICYTYFDRVQDFSNYIQELKSESTQMKLASERLVEILDDFPKEEFGNTVFDDIQGEIQFKNVKFGYGDEVILNDINLSFSPNTITALVGKSGSGKTTIISLLDYLYPNFTGQIMVDGVDIRELCEDSIRNNICVVSQNPYLFDLSVKDNMKLVKPDATDEEIWNVLKRVNVANDINSLKDKLDTNVGENGVTLSGGQKQRIAIARALLKNSKIILLDEATSALDNVTQNAVVQDIEHLKIDHTIIVIAHRLSTIKNADKIYVLDKGAVCGEGTHEQLIKTNEIYKKLYYDET